VTKRIPSQAGLGGGSSDAAAFMRLVNDICHLNLSIDRLAQIGSTIGADLPFFIYNYPSANVSGFGEIVELFEERDISIELYTPPIGCDTAAVYKSFKENFLTDIKLSSFIGWERIDSIELLERIKEPTKLNDLYLAAIEVYPELKKYERDGWYFSGSGSTFFKATPR
jgi:4-diphosphocytidyl-2-C-methyl-D-erythritol kinase